MGKVDLGFAVVGNIFKSGFEPNIIIFTTLLKGLFKENRVKDAIKLFNKITENGYICTDITYGVMVDGFCSSSSSSSSSSATSSMNC
ncbi:hypothetical protein GIB67_003556 [Kingdonia uniflora]|uniref:Pentatricopeptide repeat-containing protein n=1 Tax=Kingdonia uniflora TaxID=39325 RepID=A0A7J7MEP8_9MAGN|nr:hypothetical protein GIB67_003556 [Kingdonia uniflora]